MKKCDVIDMNIGCSVFIDNCIETALKKLSEYCISFECAFYVGDSGNLVSIVHIFAKNWFRKNAGVRNELQDYN